VPPIFLSDLESSVPSNVRKRAETYARNGAVILEPRESDQEPVAAKVFGDGGDVYFVGLSYTDGVLLGDCTCPYYNERLEVCKHIWATVLVCAREHLEFPGEVDAVAADDDVWFAGEEYEAPAPFVRPNIVPLPRLWVAPVRWRSQLDQVLRAAPYDSNRPIPEITWVVIPGGDDTLSIEITSRTLKKNGQYGTPQRLRIPYAAIAGIQSPLDREILSLIAPPYASYASLDSRLSIRSLLGEYVLPKLVATGRLLIWIGGEYVPCTTFDDGEPWELRVRAEERDGGTYVLVGTLHRGEVVRPLADALAVLPGGFLIFPGATMARFAAERGHWAALLLRDRIEIPAADVHALMAVMASALSPIHIEWPAGVAWEERRVPPRATLELSERGGSMTGTPRFGYDGQLVAALEKTRPVYDEKKRTVLVRDAAEEKRLLDALWGQSFVRESYDIAIATPRLAEVLPKLNEAGWEVRSARGVYAGPGELQLEVSSGIDWFDVNGVVTFGEEQVALPRLLNALRKGDPGLVLGDGRFGLLRSEWRDQLEPFLAAASDEQETGLRFRRNQVLLLDALLASRPEVSFDDVFEQARRRILDVKIVPEQPPDSFRGALRPYQSEGLGWFSFLRELGFGGCLADDMGLGKTIQVLALLDQRRRLAGQDRRPSLVVAPRSVVFNWKSEAARFTPELRLLDHSTPDRVRAADHFAQYDVVLTTYALLRREAELFADVEFDYAILDEAQAIKNATSQAAKAATLLRARHRLALSGTPVENHLGELASMFEFLNPGMLRAGSSRVMKMLRHAGSKAPDAADARVMLARAVRPFILRRTKAQVARELPDRVEQTIWCELEPKQRKLYDELRDFYRASLLGRVATDGINRSKIHILEALLRMRQAACHPGLVDKARTDETSAKLDALFEELPNLIDGGHKVLVFSQFTSLLAIVRNEARQRGLVHAYLDGASRDREEQVRRFQHDANVPLFLISLKAGGLGLNLTAAEYVFLLDPWWNPAVEAQAIDRAHRIGQSRNVFAYRLVARDTIEEKILLLQQNKRELADAIIGAENSILRQLTPEDLDLLLS
jgi:superfamily II DNA or RNA helicase